MSEEGTATGAEQAPIIPGHDPSTISGAAKRLNERWGTSEESVSEEAQGDVHDTDDQVEQDAAGEAIDDGAQEPQEQETSDDEPDYFQHIDELVDAVGYDKNAFMQHTKVPVRGENGETEEINLHELVQGYQRGRRHSEESERLSQARDRFQREVTQWRKKAEQDHKRFNFEGAISLRYIEKQMEEVEKHFQSQDWANLRLSSPAEYSAAQADWERAKRQIGETRAAIEQEQKAAQQVRLQQHQQQQQRYVAEQRQKMVQYRPEWKDQETRTKDAQSIAKYLSETYGATSEDIKGIVNAAHLDIAYKAMMYDGAKKVSKETGEQVRKQGQLLRPGASQRGNGRGQTIRKKATDSRERLRRTHKQSDAASALLDQWEARDRARR